MFSKVLIANRGEIALRVIRACHELGVSAVAVFSDADATAPHVRAADEAIHIGGNRAGDSYLRIDALLAAARRTNAEAVHPGYGFLSERAPFARAVHDAGLVWIGPPASAIEALGSKTAARALATRAGVPVVPGTTESLRSLEEAAGVGARLGYPVLLKAAAGGGGKGMRVVERESDIGPAWDAARREALGAFGDDAVYIEKFIDGPRHVEIQVLADTHGTVVSLGERECSLQRRHQKIIEEAPSVAVDPALRQRMGETAVRAAAAAGYVNAGTCEFLLDRSGAFYFLEMNTRIQVEHPVTELVTGLDLVQWQMRVAAGERIPFAQGVAAPNGWAIECRITSEDPASGFLPSTGLVTHLRVPTGPGVRWDGGIEPGTSVGLYYDPLLAKLIVWAPTRDAAIARMRRALRELVIDGVVTSRELHLRILADPEFATGAFDITWLERRLPSLTASAIPAEAERVAAIGAALLARSDGSQRVGAVDLATSGEGRSSPGSTATGGAVPPAATDTTPWITAARREAVGQ